MGCQSLGPNALWLLLPMDARRQTLVLYDGLCPLCRAHVRLFRRLDWFGTVNFTAIAEAGSIPQRHGLRAEDLQQAMHSIEPDGRIERGARCFRRIGLRIPLLAPLALLLWVPGLDWCGDRIYGVVSRNRYVLSRWFGCSEACALPSTPPETPAGRGRQKIA